MKHHLYRMFVRSYVSDNVSYLSVLYCGVVFVGNALKVKVKVCGFIKRLSWQASHPQGAQTWITQFNLQTTPCLPLAFVRVHQIAPPRTMVTRSSCSLLLIYRPRKDERMSWPSCLIYSRRFTHICSHPSAVGRAQDSESSPLKDQCSIAEPRNQAVIKWSVHEKNVTGAWQQTCTCTYACFLSTWYKSLRFKYKYQMPSTASLSIYVLCIKLGRNQMPSYKHSIQKQVKKV